MTKILSKIYVFFGIYQKAHFSTFVHMPEQFQTFFQNMYESHKFLEQREYDEAHAKFITLDNYQPFYDIEDCVEILKKDITVEKYSDKIYSCKYGVLTESEKCPMLCTWGPGYELVKKELINFYLHQFNVSLKRSRPTAEQELECKYYYVLGYKI